MIEQGADVNVKDQFSLSPLVYALKNQNSEIVNLLKQAGGSY